MRHVVTIFKDRESRYIVTKCGTTLDTYYNKLSHSTDCYVEEGNNLKLFFSDKKNDIFFSLL